jgi:hypothetical protein
MMGKREVRRKEMRKVVRKQKKIGSKGRFKGGRKIVQTAPLVSYEVGSYEPKRQRSITDK